MFLKKYFLTNLGLLSNKSLKNILLDSWFMKTLKLLLKKVLKQKALRNIFKIILDSLSLNIYKKKSTVFQTKTLEKYFLTSARTLKASLKPSSLKRICFKNPPVFTLKFLQKVCFENIRFLAI